MEHVYGLELTAYRWWEHSNKNNCLKRNKSVWKCFRLYLFTISSDVSFITVTMTISELYPNDVLSLVQS